MVEDGNRPKSGERSRSTIILNAPEFLAVGQNLLDQEPFNLAISRVTKGRDIDPDLVRGILLFEIHPPDPWFAQSEAESARLYYWVEKLARRCGIPVSEARRKSGVLVRAYRELVAGLRPYPDWKEYLEGQFDFAFYNYTGDWNKRHRARQPELDVSRSYASWLDISVKAEKNGRTWGIQEVFSQDFKHEPPTLRPEKAPGLRRWAILAASEIVPK